MPTSQERSFIESMAKDASMAQRNATSLRDFMASGQVAARELMRMQQQGNSALRFLASLGRDVDSARRDFAHLLTLSQQQMRSIAGQATSLADLGSRFANGISEVSQFALLANKSLAESAHFVSNLKLLSQSKIDSLVMNAGRAAAIRDSFITNSARLTEQAAETVSVLNRIRAQIASLDVSSLEKVASSLEDADSTQVDFAPDTVAIEAANALFVDVIDRLEYRQASTEKQISFLVDYVKKQPSQTQAALMNIVLNLISALIGFLIASAFTALATQDSNVQERAQVSAAIDLVQEAELPNEIVLHTRVVKRDARVTVAPGKHKQLVEILPAGTVVFALQKKGKWVEIEWLSESGKGITFGWIRSKYLSKTARAF